MISRRNFILTSTACSLARLDTANAQAANQLSIAAKVKWFDDFLGVRLDSKYSIYQFANSSSISLSSDPDALVGGWLKLRAFGHSNLSARLRLGEDIDDSRYHHPPFSTEKNFKCEARVIINANERVAMTIGMTNLYDPYNIGGALYGRPEKDGTFRWHLQTFRSDETDPAYFNQKPRRPYIGTNVPLDFLHQPNVPFVARIETSPTEVRAYIDGELKAVSNTHIPIAPGQFELQLWNREIRPRNTMFGIETDAGEYSDVSAWIDYIWAEQDR